MFKESLKIEQTKIANSNKSYGKKTCPRLVQNNMKGNAVDGYSLM